jgi:hypothetical protein
MSEICLNTNFLKTQMFQVCELEKTAMHANLQKVAIGTPMALLTTKVMSFVSIGISS